jgi:hypothetical protein
MTIGMHCLQRNTNIFTQRVVNAVMNTRTKQLRDSSDGVAIGNDTL